VIIRTRPRIVLDVRGAQRRAQATDEKYHLISEFVLALVERQPQLVAALTVDTQLPPPGFLDRLPHEVPVVDIAVPLPAWTRAPLLYQTFSAFEDLPLLQIWPRWAQDPANGLVITVLEPPPENRIDGSLHRLRYLMAEHADTVIAGSHHIAVDLEGRICVDPRRVFVAYNGVSYDYAPSSEPAQTLGRLRCKFGIEEGYLLSITSGTEVAKLLRAFASLPGVIREGHQLVVVSSEADRGSVDSVDGVITSFEWNDGVVAFSTVDKATALDLYQTCRAFVFPSRAGSCPLPVIKAMRCGAPVIVSDAGSLPEIVRDQEAMFDPSDEASLTAAMQEILTDDLFHESRREASARERARYSWDAWEVAVLEAYERAARRRP
jgi:glycosyltransferase involved in cell wall biosynthesis